MKLRRFVSNDIDTLIGWVKTADLLLQFAGPEWEFPIQKEFLQNYMATTNRMLFVLEKDDSPIAYGEIASDQKASPRLGRLLVGDPAIRGSGIGKNLVRSLIEQCKLSFADEFVYLYVFEDNHAAIKCYVKCGFQFDNGGDLEMNGRNARLMSLKLRQNDYFD